MQPKYWDRPAWENSVDTRSDAAEYDVWSSNKQFLDTSTGSKMD